jgi:hypothetical protein
MFFTENRVRYEVHYTFHPADETANAETIVIDRIFDPGGRDVSLELPTPLQFRMATACREDVRAEMRREYARLRATAAARRRAT